MSDQLFDWLKDDIKAIKDDVKTLEKKVDEILEFKYKVVGGTILASLLLTTVFQVILALIK